MKAGLTWLTQCILICATLLAAGEGPRRKADAKAPAKQADRVDVCRLLTSDEIKAVQGSGVEENKPSTQPTGGLQMSQCLYRTSAPAMSVSIALASPATQKPSDVWRKQFHAGDEKKEAKEKTSRKKAREAEEEESKPRNIKGVGDEAYWVGGPITGALYVLHGNTFFRISVGGVRDEAARIQKSVALARTALKRL